MSGGKSRTGTRDRGEAHKRVIGVGIGVGVGIGIGIGIEVGVGIGNGVRTEIEILGYSAPTKFFT